MRPRILHELSQHLAILLEKGLRGERGSESIPVYICHPLDPLEDREAVSQGTAGSQGAVGVLYPIRVSPELQLRQVGLVRALGESRGAGAGIPTDRRARLQMPALWVRVRFVFLVTGGGMEDQLGALAAALRTLHENPEVSPGEIEATVSGTAGEARERLGPWSRGAGSAGEADGVEAVAAETGADGERAAGGGPQAGRDPQAGGSTASSGDAVPAYPLRIVEAPEGWRELGLREHHLTITFEVTVPIPTESGVDVPRVLERDVHLEEERS